ncbi:hypothetical protein DB88DRAFT_45866 [Papiliotrema laurentii]|uniref:Flavin reductase like domain-containing protein n=1 Tax=Papiliotrema laurentii TaxID=5418 RepID=A0AAD9FX17_PAPLA|nr:hypothetical protein DB88DRAFT_45866 [Papiliotrema laurentii]
MTRHPPFEEVEASRPDFEASYSPVATKVPKPNFVPGSGLNTLPYAEDFSPERATWRCIKPEEQALGDMYKLMISAVTPRPIAFISTRSAEGEENLAPMSYFNMVSHDPPTIVVSVQGGSKKHADGFKDTNHNVKETKEFCVSIISEPFLEAANYTSIDAPNDISEWKLSGLTQRPSETVKPAHVAESAFSMECSLMHWYEITGSSGKTSNTVMLGRVNRIHAKEFVFDPEDPMKVLVEKLRPVARLGGITYSRTNQTMEVPRPVWDQVKDSPEVKAALEAPVKRVERE